MRRASFVILVLSLTLLGLTRVALAGDAVPTLRIGTDGGIPSDEVTATVHLDAGGAGTVLEVSNEISWNSLTPVRMLSIGQPDCVADLRVVPNFASFTCTSEPCVSLHAEVRSQGEPLADGPVYGCIFVIEPNAPGGDYPLAGSAAMWADADRQIRAAAIESGFIRVSEPTPTPTPTATPTVPVAIGVRANSAPPGGEARLQFDFTDATGRAVDTGFDMVIEEDVFNLAMIGSQCTLDGRVTSHLLTVQSLGGEDVPFGFSRVRFNVFGVVKPLTTIPSGPLLTCLVPVRVNAPLGTSPIDLQRVFANDLVGLIPGVVGLDGSLLVTTDPPTVTPTMTPTPLSPIPCVGDCDENGVVDVYEAILSIEIAQEREDLDTCPAIDSNDDGHVTADELVTAVGNILDGCPP
jgi:hypothetical protein